ncbi:MAG: hypothetical protein M3Z75_23260 [Actinomycetota bacterium]|nr:hypothetical protein [Actinomycetota bacterium]
MADSESDISLQAAQVAADITEEDRPQERHRVVRAFTKAASSAGRGTRAVRSGAGSGTRAARQQAGAGTGYLVAQVIAMAPRLRVRNQAALRAQFPGKSPDEIADALIQGAARASAAAGGTAGMVSVLPVLPAFPAEIVAETLVVVGIEIKLVAELHEAYGTPAPGKFPERMSAYLAAWAHRRGVSPVPGGVIFAAGSPLTRLLRRRLTARAGRSAASLGPLLTGAAAGAFLNGRETRKLGQYVRDDLRGRAPGGPAELDRDKPPIMPGR